MLSTIQSQFELTWLLAQYHLPKMTDENCLWAPSDNVWTVRLSTEGRWRPDFVEAEPEPIPTPTIAWISWQILWWWNGALATLEGRTPPSSSDIDWPGSALATRNRLEELSLKWRVALSTLEAKDVGENSHRMVPFPWSQPKPLAEMLGWVNVELMKNIAEIGYVLHLYGNQGSKPAHTQGLRHVSISVGAKPEEVYVFAANPLNLPKWAEGLSRSEMRKADGYWIAESPMGQVKVRFTPKNEFGILDHDVTLPSGDVVHNPLRVMKNGQGSEVIFTLYHRPEMSNEDFEADATAIMKDLRRLKSFFG